MRLQKTERNLRLEMYSSSVCSFEKPTRIPPMIIKIPKRFGNKSIVVVLKKPTSSPVNDNPLLKKTGTEISTFLITPESVRIPMINDGIKINQPMFLKRCGKSCNVFISNNFKIDNSNVTKTLQNVKDILHF